MRGSPSPGHLPSGVSEPSRRAAPVAVVALLGALLAGCLPAGGSASSSPEASEEVLPSPRAGGPISLEEALAARRSVRSFAHEPLTRAEIGQLLWAAQGITDAEGRRTAPSAGARYPLELDVVTADGVARYVPARHALVRRSSADLRARLAGAAFDQAMVGEAPLVVVISAIVERTAARYGSERAERYVAMEVGHAAQNLLLEAVALDLGAVPVGAFDDAAVRRLLGLAADETPLYILPVGRPR